MAKDRQDIKVDIVARMNYDRLRELLKASEEEDYFPDIGGSDEEKAAPIIPAAKERWSFQPPQNWQPKPTQRPFTRSVKARRTQEQNKLHSKTRGKGTGSINREERRQ